MKIEFSSQRREMLLFLTTNIAAVTSRANQHFFLPLSCSFGPDMSIRWLQSLCFSLLESILISQPIMVLLIVFLNSLLHTMAVFFRVVKNLKSRLHEQASLTRKHLLVCVTKKLNMFYLRYG